MTEAEIIQSAGTLATLLGMIFVIWNSIRRPQEKTEKQDAIFSEQLKQLRLDFTNLKDNHLHTLDIKVDGIRDEVGGVKIEVAKLTTIIDERLPKK